MQIYINLHEFQNVKPNLATTLQQKFPSRSTWSKYPITYYPNLTDFSRAHYLPIDRAQQLIQQQPQHYTIISNAVIQTAGSWNQHPTNKAKN